jgi:hypothetical protein
MATDCVAQLTFRYQRLRVPIAYSMRDLVRQRVFGLAAGYLDGNDVRPPR